MISFGKSVKEKIRERINDEDVDIIGIVIPQVIVSEGSSNYFYTVEGIEITKHSTVAETFEEFMDIIKREQSSLLKKIEEKINSSNIIYVENGGNPHLISVNKISEVQTIFE